MNKNIQSLLKALAQVNYTYRLVDGSSNFVEVIKNSKFFYFTNYAVPLNFESDAAICKDKDFQYKIFKDLIKIPKTISYLDPNLPKRYNEYMRFFSLAEIVKDILLNFKFPIIIKQNSGMLGINVFLCKSSEEIKNALTNIFNTNSKEYDYVALAQEYIEKEEEYRVILLDKEIQFVYRVDSPKMYLIKDKQLLASLQTFINPIFQKLDLRFCGLDIIKTKDNNFCLIEVNSKPSFDYFFEDIGEEELINLYIKILERL